MTEDKLASIAVFLTLATVLAVPAAANASLVTLGETGNTRASATNVDAYFDLATDANIFNSTTVPHASIHSTNDAINDVDWYSFTVTG